MLRFLTIPTIPRRPPICSPGLQERGGLSMSTTVHLTHLDQAIVSEVMKEYRARGAPRIPPPTPLYP